MQQPAAAQPQPAQPVADPVQPLTMPTDDDFLANPAAATQRALQMKEAELTPQFQNIYQNNASMAREMVRAEEREIFDTYGPEVDQLINQMALEQRTPENIRLAVKMVKGNHIDDLVRKQMAEQINRVQDNAGMRPDGGVMPLGTSTSTPDGVDFDIEKLAESSPQYAQLLREANITPQVLREFLDHTECRTRGISRKQAFEEWVAKAKDGDTTITGGVF
jgi:hypothetical protein